MDTATGGVFTKEAREFGIAPPKGILLIGIPGTGKSLSAKMIASLWKMPLVRFDVGSLFGSLLGESEVNTRHALRLTEALAPCILWIDELEKAMSRGGMDGRNQRPCVWRYPDLDGEDGTLLRGGHRQRHFPLAAGACAQRTF